ncbi:hypothetical protein LWI29_028325 [Acer saccharum]|uniref:Uncharacterized protein n=1 Tax=Acer saccharum TaxID=4024 RepID=A0AA39S073_ACESA|nr:hypothetical protein LWI29_028325 [Acer saccharum]
MLLTFHENSEKSLQELAGDSEFDEINVTSLSDWDESDLILLPKQLWCSLKESADRGTFCEAGWLFDHGRAITSRCIFSSDAKLKEISIARETASSDGV